MLQIREIPIESIRPASYNPRKINDAALEGLKNSVKKFGMPSPLVVNSRSGVLVSGHQRLRVAELLGWKTVPVVEVDLTPAEEKALNVTLNNKHIGGDFTAGLAEVLDEVRLELGDDFMASLCLDDIEIPEIEFLEDEESNAAADEVPAPPIVPNSKLGDLWTLGNHRLLCGDSTDILQVERLMDGKKADMVFTDPPYNIAEKTKGIASQAPTNKQNKKLMNCEWDKGFDFESVSGSIFIAIAENSTVYVCSSSFVAPKIWDWMEKSFDFSGYCVWSKPNPFPSLMKRRWAFSSELICYATRGKQVFNYPLQGNALSVWTIPIGEGGLHPTQKPIRVSEHAIVHSSNPHQLILDLFGGSGSTLIACEKTKRQCFMMELDPKYIDVILTRWAKFSGKDPVRDDGVTWSELNTPKYEI